MVTRIYRRVIQETFSILKTVVVFAVTLCMVVSCANKPRINLEGPYWKDNDTKPIPEMDFDEPDLLWVSLDHSIFVQGMELLDIDRNIRKISGHMTQAMNTNAFDEVPNSSWFTNRHGLPQTHMTPEELFTGPQTTEGPDMSGIWTLFRPKVGGATIGFWIEDSRGDQYIIKPDPKGSPELSSGAAAIGSKFFRACGYNAPLESIVYWRPEQVRIKEGVTFTDVSGKKRTFTQEHLDDILSNIHIDPDGKIRSLASQNIGNVKGPFMYMGTRKDDPNDWCPHEHRRELRGLYVVGSLMNHYDLKGHNSMDVYVGESGSGHLRHYLMDFGSILGSQGRMAKLPAVGYANTVDIRDILVSMTTLGLKTWPHEYAKPHEYPSIGYFESELFEPNQFDVIYPNPAFEQMTDQDAYWGAKIVMAFSKEDIQSLVKTGRYTNPEAEAYLLKTLLERREKIGRHWFGKVNPLDYPTVISAPESLELTFRDLAIDYGLETADAKYHYEIHHNGESVLASTVSNETTITLNGDDLISVIGVGSEKGSAKKQAFLYELRVRTQRGAGKVSSPTIFWIHYEPSTEQFSVVGIEHPS